MATTNAHTITVLIGPTCPTCEPDDLNSLGAPRGALRQCPDCGTEYRRYRLPTPSESPNVEARCEVVCPSCGLPHDHGDTGSPFCEDCELSDCMYCGMPTNRCNLSENLACRVCEEGEVAA
jgi:hypothetical protein